MTVAGEVAQVSGVLPEGFALPDPIYAGPVIVALLGAAALVYAISPPVTDWTPVALAPWVGVGATLHVLYQQPTLFPVVQPLFGNPMVYLTTAAVTGFVWITSDVVAGMRGPHASVDRQTGAFGMGIMIALVTSSVWFGSTLGTLRPFWPVLGLALAAMGTGFAWVALSLTFTDAARTTARTGVLVVFAHTLDGVSTAIGIDILGVSERTPFSRAILDYGAQLPTAEVIGAGWLFVFVKLLLAMVVVTAFKGYVEDRPAEARLLLMLVAAVGLGPGIHNLLLFTVRESVVGI